jgi:hypothetical protein
MSKVKSKEVVAEVQTSAAAPSEKKSEAKEVTQSKKEIEVVVIKDFKGLKAGEKVVVSENIAELLTNKGLVK